MRAALEALLVIGGGLLIFWFTYSQYLKLRRQERAAEQDDRERESNWLNKNL